MFVIYCNNKQIYKSEMEGIIGKALIALMIFVGGYWSKGFRDEYLPSFNRIILALKNILRRKPQRTQDRFRVVLCWLENDKDGDNTKIVASAFTNVEGITLDHSAHIVKASGAADDWQPAMQKSARRVLEIWNADLVLVGTVKKSQEILNLWFVPRTGDGTLARGDKPYILENVTLDKDFHSDFHTQLTAVALAAVAPLADTDMRGKVLDEGLRVVTDNLNALLMTRTIAQPEERARLQLALGVALSTLGERESA